MNHFPDFYHPLRKDIPDAAGVMMNAFAHDPLWIHFFAGFPYKQRLGSFLVPLSFCRRYGGLFSPSENLEGACAWLEGKWAEYTLPRMICSRSLRYGLQMGRDLSRRMEPLFDASVKDMKENLKERDFIYLQMLGVARKHQGKGFGGRMLQALIDKGDREGRPVYLETETEENVAWYGKRGFEVMKKITLEPAGLPLWEMIREPAPPVA